MYFGIVDDGVDIVLITANPSDLSPGYHKSEIVITSSFGTRTVPVSITVLGDNDNTRKTKLRKINLDATAAATQVGRKLYIHAVGVYLDGSRKDITKEIKWVSRNKRVGYFSDKGLFIGKRTGDVSVFAKKDGVKSPEITIHIDALDGPVLKVSLPKIKLDHMEKGSVEDIPLTLRNAGKGELEWEITSQELWLVLNGGISSSGVGSDMQGKWEASYSSLHGSGKGNVKIVVDTRELPDGKHEGSVLIRSNGGDEKIIIPVTIRSLESISLTPISVKTAVNRKTMFRATGMWSDGSRTDLSRGLGGRWIISDPSIGFFPRGRSVFVARKTGYVEIIRVRGDVSSNVAVVDVVEDVAGPVLLVSPREVDFGTVGPGESSKGVFSLKNVGGGNLTWLVNRMGDWISPYDDTLSGTAGMSARSLRVSIESMADNGASVNGLSDIRMIFKTGHKAVSYRKLLPPGSYREELKVSFNGGDRTVFLKFVVAEKEGSRSSMDIRPLEIDLGSVDVGRKFTKRIELRNTGGDVLKWKAILQGNRKTFRGVVLERVGYTSFADEAVSGKGKKDWIRISPKKGTTTNEVDYINAMVNTKGLLPGSHSENILFYSSESVKIVKMSLDIKDDKVSELTDIYRYTKGTDNLLSPDVTRGDFSLEGYKKSGPIFRLFHKDTPGTTEFFQWHNPSRATHFYSYNRSGGKHSLKGYIFDGSIGSIATLKLLHTRDLYRWFNPETRAYFYTTDPKGEGHEKMGYIYDGVAGYVR